jgi:hypothetical protein
VTITTYTTLKAATSEWLARNGDTDIDTRFDDLLALQEQRMYYGSKEVPGILPAFEPLRIREMEQADTSFSLSSATVAQPTGFLELISAELNTSQGPLDIVTEGVFDAYGSTTLGGVKLIAVSGSNFRFKDTPASDTATLRYFKKLTTPSGSNSTNSILTTFPSLYLNGCLMQAAIYTGDPETAKLYGALYAAEVGGLNERRNSELRYATNVRLRIRGSTP